MSYLRSRGLCPYSIFLFFSCPKRGEHICSSLWTPREKALHPVSGWKSLNFSERRWCVNVVPFHPTAFRCCGTCQHCNWANGGEAFFWLCLCILSFMIRHTETIMTETAKLLCGSRTDGHWMLLVSVVLLAPCSRCRQPPVNIIFLSEHECYIPMLPRVLSAHFWH